MTSCPWEFTSANTACDVISPAVSRQQAQDHVNSKSTQLTTKGVRSHLLWNYLTRNASGLHVHHWTSSSSAFGSFGRRAKTCELNGQIICRRESKQTGMIMLLRVASLPWVIWVAQPGSALKDTQILRFCRSALCETSAGLPSPSNNWAFQRRVRTSSLVGFCLQLTFLHQHY